MNVILVVFGCIILGLFWKTIWRPALLGYFRDRLFALRDDLRGWCVKNGHSLDSTQYHACRDFLNSSLRYLERYNTLDMMAYMVIIPENSPIMDKINMNFEASMRGENQSLNNKVKEIRSKSFKFVASYMVLRSFPLCCIAMLTIAKEVIFAFCKGVFSRDSLAQAVAASILFASISVTGGMPSSAPRKQNVAIILSDKVITY